MSVLMWIFVGFVFGFLTSRFVNETGKGLFVDIGVGIAGALIAGWLSGRFGPPEAGVTLYGAVAATAGAIGLLVTYRMVFNKA
jgi:uncharacterized membrane protein YeaQ/YmgE (transglycosylase-associated protein family)